MRFRVSLLSCLWFLGSLSERAAAVDSLILISVSDQKLALLQEGQEVARYPISTSKFGQGDSLNSYATPLGWLQVARKIGDQAQPGAVFKKRALTGEILPPNAPGRDPIVTRILWLRGLESQNKNSFRRCIYIHGTPEEKLLGKPVSWGCIRMRSKDVVTLFDCVSLGTKVEIQDQPIRRMIREQAAPSRPLFAAFGFREGAE
jgi:lipoprotein-anchoring transpeptidase ErfK/SrfK